jgi:hypothetical protein
MLDSLTLYEYPRTLGERLLEAFERPGLSL